MRPLLLIGRTMFNPPAPAPAAAALSPPPQRASMPALVRRTFFVSTALVALGAAAVVSGSPLVGPAAELGSAGVEFFYGVVAVLALLALALPSRAVPAGMVAISALLSLAIAYAAQVSGGAQSVVALAGYGVLAGAMCSAASLRAGFVLAGFQALLTLAVWQAPHLGWGRVEAGLSLPLVAALLIALAAFLTAGVTTATSLLHHRRVAAERAGRFQRLLGLAADAYWEIDQEYRLVSVSEQSEERRSLEPGTGLGQRPWELPAFGCDGDTLDSLLAHLDAREPFREIPMRWSHRADATRELLVSGEPRFGVGGRFVGYWGVARDVTETRAARAALAATENRYRELFSLSPTALVVHRGGVVLDANPAALRLFGQEGLDTMLGSNLLDAHAAPESRERAWRRMEQLRNQPAGTALPTADLRLLIRGRGIAVRVSTVCVEVAGRPALMSIYEDDSERRAAEESVRRSETLLSQVVNTSPDMMTLTDLVSGRYLIVNPAFERMLGWSVKEAVGRTSLELGVWPAREERRRFVRRLLDEGVVNHVPLQINTRDGRRLSLLVSAARFTMERHEYIVMAARDLSDSERLRREREAILENASVGIAFTRERHFLMVNRCFESMFGWPAGELVGQLSRVVWPSDAAYDAMWSEHGETLARGDAADFEVEVARRDGSIFLAGVRAHAIDPAAPTESGTVWIVEDITERRRAERALQQARHDAEAASRAKSAFLANTSHELRTPLNGIVGLAELVRDPTLPTEQRQRFLDQIGQSARALAGIISDILDLSKIEAGRLQIERSTFDLGDLIDDLRQTCTPQAQAKGLDLRFDISHGVAGPVLGDALRLRQVIQNFLGNAIKFTELGHVVLRAYRPGGSERVRVEVQDTGPGLDEGVRARLFEPFTQADESTTRRYGGTGLGLSICRELAGLMGGTVGVESALGAGSLFWVQLPLPVALPPPPPPPADEGASLEGMRVLMVEDNIVNMTIALAMLERWGVQVTPAYDGEQAVAAVAQAEAAGQPFDAVLMDLQMPRMSGKEAAQAIRAREAARHLPDARAPRVLPIVALTAAALTQEREEALQAGMDDFLTKPIDAERLRSTLARLCHA